jgi:hypothetical protein
MRWSSVLVVLVACGGGNASGPVKPITVSPVAEKPAPRPACIRVPEEAAAIMHAGGDDAHVSYCIGTAVDQCFSLELASGKLTALAEPPAAQDKALASAARVETTNPELKVCRGDQCKTLTPQVWPGAAPLRAATNGSVAAVMLGDAEAGKGYVEIYEVLKAKKVATFKYARGEFKCGEIGMLGDTLYVGAHTCNAPSGRATLYTAKGKKLANVGGKPDFGMYGSSYTQVDGNTWAFLGENGVRIAIQDVVTGKVARTIDATALFETKMGNPGESAIVRLDAGKLAVIAGTPANGSVAIVDVATGEVKVVRAPLCT